MQLKTKAFLTGIVGTLSLIFSVPVWAVLVYLILDHIHATTTMWVLYWIYTPLMMVIGVASNWLTTVVAKIEVNKPEA